MKLNRTTTFALAAAAALALPTAAIAATPPKQTLDIGVSPTKAGTKKAPKNVVVTIHGHTDPGKKDDGTDDQPIMQSVKVSFAKGLVLNPKPFKTCDFKKAEAEGSKACPAAAKIGGGVAAAMVGTQAIEAQLGLYKIDNNTVAFTIDVNAFNITTSVRAPFASSSDSKYDKTINLGIPAAIQQPVPGVDAKVTDMKLTIDGKAKVKQGKKTVSVSYVQTTSCPSAGKWEFLGEFQSSVGKLDATSEVACKK